MIVCNSFCILLFHKNYIFPCLICKHFFFSQLLEQELELQHKEFSKLNGSAQNLVTHLDQDNQAIEDIRSRLEEFSQRWDSIVQQMEAHSKAVSNMTLEEGEGGQYAREGAILFIIIRPLRILGVD